MRKLIYMLLLCSVSAQAQNLLLASQQQFGNEGSSNLYTLANAANPDSEVNGTTGFGSTTNCTISSVSTAPTAQNGTYSLKVSVTTPGVVSTSYLTLDGLTTGETYTIQCYLYASSGNWDFQALDWEGWTETTDVSAGYGSTGSWVYKEMTVTASADTPRRLRAYSSTAGSAPVYLAIDNIIITHVP